MILSILDIWRNSDTCGFAFLEFDFDREDDLTYALLGFYYDKEEKELMIDFFWRYFTFNFNKQ